jgi:hypothetical protein
MVRYLGSRRLASFTGRCTPRGIYSPSPILM